MCAVCLCAFLARGAKADPACAPLKGDWVLFALSAEFDPGFAEAARAHLAAELEPRGVSVCTRPPTVAANNALARVFVSGSPDGVAILRIEDDVTQTTVQRKIDFSRVPSEGRALTFGLAADELLGVGWASAVAKTPPAAEIVAQGVPPTPPRSRPYHASVAFDVATYRQGPTLGGPAASLSMSVGHWVPEVRFGMRYGPSLTAEHGEVAFRDLHAALGTTWLVQPLAPRFQWGPVVAIELQRVDVQGQAQRGGSARQGQSWAALAQGGLAGAWKVNRAAFVSARLTAGYVLLPVRAADAGQSVGGIASFVTQGSVAVGVMF